MCIYKWQSQDNIVDLKLVLAERAAEELLAAEEALAVEEALAAEEAVVAQ
jgi:hypothetical protein